MFRVANLHERSHKADTNHHNVGHLTLLRSTSSDSDEESDADDLGEDDDAPSSIQMDVPKWQSTTPPQKPVTRDR